MKADLFIPVWNIKDRGFDRLRFLLYSCAQQQTKFNRIWICDGSHPIQAAVIGEIVIEAQRAYSLPVIYTHSRQGKFNKPKLINGSAWHSDADLLIFSDVDYLFSPDLLTETLAVWRYDQFLIKESRNLNFIASKEIFKETILEWEGLSRLAEPNGFPVEVACGAFQVHSRDFFRHSKGLNEKMQGMSGMDEEYLKRAKLAGLNVKHIPGGEILHQYHRSIKSSRTPSPDQKRNWQLLANCNSVIQNT